jgi:hypothetical protein
MDQVFVGLKKDHLRKWTQSSLLQPMHLVLAAMDNVVTVMFASVYPWHYRFHYYLFTIEIN